MFVGFGFRTYGLLPALELLFAGLGFIRGVWATWNPKVREIIACYSPKGPKDPIIRYLGLGSYVDQ